MNIIVCVLGNSELAQSFVPVEFIFWTAGERRERGHGQHCQPPESATGPHARNSAPCSLPVGRIFPVFPSLLFHFLSICAAGPHSRRFRRYICFVRSRATDVAFGRTTANNDELTLWVFSGGLRHMRQLKKQE